VYHGEHFAGTAYKGSLSTVPIGDIRKATPVIVFSLFLMLVAEIVNVVGYLRKDYRTIVGAVLSIISGTGLQLFDAGPYTKSSNPNIVT